MAKITQIITRPSQEYDYTIAEAQVSDLDGVIQKLNTTYEQDVRVYHKYVCLFLLYKHVTDTKYRK